MLLDDQIRQALMSKDKATLLNFIREKGTQRKAEMLEAARFQTQDYSQTGESLVEMQKEVERLQQEQQQFNADMQARQEAQNNETANIESLQAALDSKRAALSREQESGEKSDQFVTSCQQATPGVTKDVVKKCNKILENESPPQLITLLEHFVALLRNKAGTKPVDVELFMKDDGKLRSQMTKTSTTSCSLDIVNAAADAVDRIADQFGPPAPGEVDCSPFFVFLDWSMNFCKAAKIDLRLSSLEADVAKAQEDIERAQLSIERFNQSIRDTAEFNFQGYYTDMIGTMQERVDLMTNINQQDEQQAQVQQQKHHSFDKNYLSGYLAAS